MKKNLTLAFFLCLFLAARGQNACQRATPIDCGQTISNCPNGTANNGMNGLTYWCLFDAYGSGSTGRDTVFKLQVNQTKTYHFVLDMLNGKDMDLIVVKPGNFNTSCDFANSCTVANGGFSYEYNHSYGIFREVLDIRLDANPNPYLLFVDSKEPGQALFNLTVDCNCRGVEADNDLPTGERMFCDNFENYVPNKVIEPQSTRWERRDSTLPDGKVVSAGFLGQGVQFTGTAGSIPEDHFLLRNRYSTIATAGQAAGRYRISWKMRMEYGKKGYYAVEHVAPVNVPAGVFNDAYHVSFLENGTGEVRAGGIGTAPIATFAYPQGVWMNVVQIIDIESNKAELWINDNFVKKWNYNIGSTGTSTNLASIKFKADLNHDFKVDELCVWKGGSCSLAPGTTPVVENGVGYASEAAARCNLYTSLEWGDGRHICDYGGTFVHRGDHFAGKLERTEIAPNLLRNEACVLAEYGGVLPDTLFSDIYIFYKDDTNPVKVNLVEDNGTNTLKKFVFSCNAPGAGGQCQVGPRCLTETALNSGIYLPNTCDSFYYVVITGGTVNKGYDFSIGPVGPCGINFEDIDPPCGGSCLPTFRFGPFPATSNFNAVGPGNAYESCYSGTRTYTGGDKVYRFVMAKPSVINLELTGNSPVGMALYSVICAKQCITFAESKGPDNRAILNTPLAEGVYYLIVDKSVDDNLRDFTLTFTCDNKSFFDLQSLLISGGKPGKGSGAPGISAKVPPICLSCDLPPLGPEYYHHFILNNQNALSPGDEIHFLFRDNVTQYLTGSEKLSWIWDPSNSAQEFPLIRDYVDTIPPPVQPNLKCSFYPNDSVFIYVTQTSNGNHLFREIKPSYVPAGVLVATATNIFHPADTSIVNNFALGTSVTWHISTTRIKSSPGGGTRDFDFHSSIPWVVTELVDAPWLSISESSGTGGISYKLRLTLQPNVSQLPRTTTLEFASTERPDIYRLYLVVTQLPYCTPPQIVLEPFNSSLCENDTVFLRANVGTDLVTGESLAPLYDFVWKNGNGQVVTSPIKVPEGQYAAILSTGTYTYTVEATGKYCDGFDTQNITFSVTPPPNPPTPNSSTAISICQGKPFPAFSVNNPPPGQIIQWFETATGGNSIAAGAVFIPNTYITKTYYAGTAYAGNSCASGSRVAFQLTVNSLPTVTVSNKVCSPDHQFYGFNIQTNGSNVFVNNVPQNGNGGNFQIQNISIGIPSTVRIANQFCDTIFTVTPPVCMCDVNVPGFVQHYSVCADAPAPAMTVTVLQQNVSVNWYNAATNGTKLNTNPTNPFTPQQPYLAAYYAEAVNLLNGCTSPTRQMVQLTVLTVPSLVLLDTNCTAMQDFYSISISTNGADATANFGNKAFANGIYTFSQIPVAQAVTITATGANGCTQTVSVNPPNCPCLTVIKPTSGGDHTICFGNPYPQLSVQVGLNQTANWYLNGVSVAPGVTQFTPDQAGVYQVETYDPALDCVSSEKTTVTLTVQPEIQFSTTVPQCAINRKSYSFSLNAGANTAVMVNGQPVLGSAGVFNVGNIMTGTNAEIVVTNLATSCTATKTIVSPACPCVGSINAPGSVASNANPVCQGLTKTLTATVGANQTVNWYNAQNTLVATGTLNFNPGTQNPGMFSFYAEAFDTITDCVSTNKTQIDFTVNPLPTFQISKACQSQTTYTVTVTLLNGNTLTATSGMIVTGPNNVFFVKEIALGSPVTITATNTLTGCTADVTLTSPINCDCTLFGDIVAPLAGPNQSACVGQSVFPAVTASVTQQNVVIDWYNAAGTLIASSTAAYVPPANLPAGVYNYYAEARDSLTQCISVSRSQVQLVVSDPPALTLSSSCEPSFLTYQVSGQTEPGIVITHTSGVFNAIAPGFFTISGIDKGQAVTITATNPVTHCVSSETVLLSTCPCPTVNKPVSNGDKAMCQGDPTAPVLSVQVTNTGLETVYWYLTPSGGVPITVPGTSYQPVPPPATTTSYYAETRLLNGFCPSANREKVTLDVKTRPVAAAGTDQTICAGDTVALHGMITGVSGGYWVSASGQFLPNNGVLTASNFVAPYGTPGVTLTLITDDPAGPCPADSSTLFLTLLDAPTITIDSVYCNHNFSAYNVLFSSNTTMLTVLPVPAVSQGNQHFLASNINLAQNLLITGVNQSTSCDKTITVVAPNPCTCPTVNAPQSLLGATIARCANEGLPTITVQVDPGLMANWYNSANATIPFLSNSLQYTPGAPGDYFVEAMDPANDCKSSRIKISVILKPQPVVFAGPNAAVCPGASVTLSVDAGAGYTYLWTAGQTTQDISVSSAGTYYVSVTLDGCTALDSFMVSLHPALLATIQVVEPIHCFGFSNGVLKAVPTGGTLPINAYQWSNQSGQQTITGLSAGTYTVTMVDQAGCSATVSYPFGQPNPLSISNIDKQQPDPGQSNGVITLQVGGGTGPYSYQWYMGTNLLAGETQSSIDSIPKGQYLVEITDAFGCTLTSSFISLGTVDAQNPDNVRGVWVFPNPTSGHLSIKISLTEPAEVQVQVMDVLGRELETSKLIKFADGQLDLNLSAYPEGLYWLKIKLGSSIVVKKVALNR